MINAILAEADPSTSSLAWLWDFAKTAGPGATAVLIVVVYNLAKAYKEKDAQVATEVAYSKKLGQDTLIITGELTTMIKAIDKRDIESVGSSQLGTSQILASLADLKGLIITRLLDQSKDHDAKIIRPAA